MSETSKSQGQFLIQGGELVENEKEVKTIRALDIYTQLLNGYIVNKAQMAEKYGVNERSIQRDIETIRIYMAETDNEYIGNTIVYDRIQKGYRLEKLYKMKLTNSEVLAICKILLDSRAFPKSEMEDVLGKLIECCVPESNRKLVEELIRNEEYHYIQTQHGISVMPFLWEIGQAISQHKKLEFDYQGVQGHTLKHRVVQPQAIMFSEYYFYLTAFIDDDKVRENFNVLNDSFPTIYRIDRIQSLKVLDETFHIPYKDRFEEGEFRKRIQFMYGGKLRKVKFEYTGYAVEAVLDRLPTAKILSEEDGKYVMSAEVFGDGIDMWLRSQGDIIKLL